VIARQLARSGTSIGANVEEAQGSHSRAEFIRRMGIARSEARETFYWLRIIGETGMIKPSRLVKITAESEELLRILTAIVKNSRIR
jgi:four helix bundle protein